MATITFEDQTITPSLVLTYSVERASRNIVHPILADATPVVTLRPASTRSGTLRLFFDTEEAALVAEDAHALAVVLTLDDPEHPALSMRYVTNGAVRLVQDDEKPEWWTVEAAFQEVGS